MQGNYFYVKSSEFFCQSQEYVRYTLIIIQ